MNVERLLTELLDDEHRLLELVTLRRTHGACRASIAAAYAELVRARIALGRVAAVAGELPREGDVAAFSRGRDYADEHRVQTWARQPTGWTVRGTRASGEPFVEPYRDKDAALAAFLRCAKTLDPAFRVDAVHLDGDGLAARTGQGLDFVFLHPMRASVVVAV